MKKFIIEPEYDGYEIGTYLKETKGYLSRRKEYNNLKQLE